jgi:hypothetical protein
MAPPQVVVADNFTSRAHNKDIRLNPGPRPGLSRFVPQENDPHPPGVRSLFVRFLRSCIRISILFSFIYSFAKRRLHAKTRLESIFKSNGINACACGNRRIQGHFGLISPLFEGKSADFSLREPGFPGPEFQTWETSLSTYRAISRTIPWRIPEDRSIAGPRASYPCPRGT